MYVGGECEWGRDQKRVCQVIYQEKGESKRCQERKKIECIGLVDVYGWKHYDE